MSAKCQFCGGEIPDEANFCGSCGARKPVAAAGAAVESAGAGAGETAQLPPAAPVPSGATAIEQAWATPYLDHTPVVRAAAEYQYAGFWVRLAAYVIDAIIAFALAIVPALVLGAVLAAAAGEYSGTGFGLGLLIGGYGTWFVYWWITTSMGGGPGKRLLGLRVVEADTGENPDRGIAFMRELSRVLFNLISILGLLDHLWAAWDAKKQTWHDKAAGTYVVRR